MQTVIQISLSGHPVMFRLNQDAYAVLEHYLDRARLNLAADPDQAEVLRDLELAIGEKLTARQSAPDQVLTLAEVNAVLAEVGPVETGSPAAPAAPALPRGRRRLMRIQEGQQIAGVCQGLAAYADLDVDWVHTIFILLTLVTGGAFGLVYLVLMFVLPAVPTRAAYAAAHAAASPTA